MKDEELKLEEIESSHKLGERRQNGKVPRREGSVERVSGMLHGTSRELYVQSFVCPVVQ